MTARLTSYLAGLTAFAAAVFAGGAAPAHADTLNEGFESLSTLQLATSGWTFRNNSTLAAASLWRQGSNAANSIGPAPAGTVTSYALANFTETTSTAATGATISQWMVTPVLNYANGGTISFFTRTGTGATFADRLQVRFSTGSAGNVGTLPTDVGTFTTLLLDINPTLATGAANYPDVWTQYNLTLSGLAGPTTGQVAFRYFVDNAGTNGANSNIIGVDTLAINSGVAAVPEPGTLALLLPAAGALMGGVVVRRRRAAK